MQHDTADLPAVYDLSEGTTAIWPAADGYAFPVTVEQVCSLYRVAIVRSPSGVPAHVGFDELIF